MAATGLLGINPYQKGIALDISSKPTNLAIQLEQKEAAKREALDKYFMDYEKSLSPTGMRSQDQDIFMQKLNANRAYYLENRDKILNPTKYGAQYQSQYMAGFKDMLSDVARSKQAAANDKIAQEHYYQAQQKGLEVPDGYMNAIKYSQLPINNPQYKAVDPYQWNFNKPFDVEEFRKDIYGNVQPSERRIKSVPDNKGEIIDTFKYELAPDQLKSVATNAMLKYQTNAGVRNKVNNLIRTGEYKNLDEYYKILNPKGSLDDANPEHVAAALGLSLNLIGKTAEKRREDKMYWLSQQEGKEKRTAEFKQGLQNKEALSDFSTALTEKIDAAKRNPVVVLNEKTGKKETWNVLPLTKNEKDQFTIPVSIVTENKTPYTVQKEVDHIYVTPENKFIGYTQKLDENGKPIPHKFDQVEITAKDLALQILTPYTTSKNRKGAVESAVNAINAPKEKVYMYNGETYSEKQIAIAAKQWNMTPEQYIKKYNIQTK